MIDSVVMIRLGSVTHGVNRRTCIRSFLTKLALTENRAATRSDELSSYSALRIRSRRSSEIDAIHPSYHVSRIMERRCSSKPTGQVRIVTPPDANKAPPGYYMVFALAGGVPSSAPMPTGNITQLH